MANEMDSRRLAHRGAVRRRISGGRIALLTLAALSLYGCAAVGPDYQTPVTALPEQWQTSHQPAALAAEVLPQWWRQFDDAMLDDLVEQALAANLDLATATAQLREARAQRGLAGAQLGPSVDGSVSGSRSRSSARSGSGDTSEVYNAGFDASWEADIFGGLRRGVEAAQADLEASRESLRDVQVSLVAEVVVNYLDLRVAQQRIQVAEANLATLEQTLQLTEWQLQAGLASELDVAQARTDLETTRASLPALHTTAAGALNRLAVLLGQAPGVLQPRLAPRAAVPHTAQPIAVGIPADILRQRPDVRQAERNLAAQTARLGEAEAARYPSFNLSGSLGLQALTFSSLGNSGATTSSLLGAITAPIFDSGRISANIEVADAQLEQARLAYRSAVLTALEEVENALVGIANGREQRDRLARATDAARLTLQLARQRYAAGLIDFLTLLDSQRSLQSLEDQLVSSDGELALAQAQLYKALGGGWAPDTAFQGSGDES